MARNVMLLAWYLLACLVAFGLVKLGEYASTGLRPDALTINAFLFLMGLGSALTLLSPTSRPRRLRRW